MVITNERKIDKSERTVPLVLSSHPPLPHPPLPSHILPPPLSHFPLPSHILPSPLTFSHSNSIETTSRSGAEAGEGVVWRHLLWQGNGLCEGAEGRSCQGKELKWEEGMS